MMLYHHSVRVLLVQVERSTYLAWNSREGKGRVKRSETVNSGASCPFYTDDERQDAEACAVDYRLPDRVRRRRHGQGGGQGVPRGRQCVARCDSPTCAHPSAVQCIGEAFGVDPTDSQQRSRLAIKPATLPSIFDVYLKTQASRASTASSSSGGAPAPKPAAGPSAADKAEAEKLKQTGNQHMTGKRYAEAIDAYTKAIALDPKNPVYYSNRAAAYSSTANHTSAVTDAEKAIEVDPAFVKAYHRLGCAHAF